MGNSPRDCGPGGQWLGFIFIWWGIVLMGSCQVTQSQPVALHESQFPYQIKYMEVTIKIHLTINGKHYATRPWIYYSPPPPLLLLLFFFFFFFFGGGGEGGQNRNYPYQPRTVSRSSMTTAGFLLPDWL